MCEELHDPFEDQVACARYRAERDALAQAVQAVCERMEAHFLGVEGMDDSPVASWARDLRAALGSLHAPGFQKSRKVANLLTPHSDASDTTMSAHDLLPQDEREAIAWVREHGGLDEVLEWEERDQSRLACLLRIANALLGGVSLLELDGRLYEIAYEVERRIMPEGTEWPRFEDWKQALPGDKVCLERYDAVITIEKIAPRYDGYAIYDTDLIEHVFDSGIRLKRPAPKALDADGAEIRVGDTMWHVETGEQCRVVEVNSRSVSVDFRVGDDGAKHTGSVLPANLTHRAPVLAADGEPLEAGQTVWNINNGMEFSVSRLPKPGEYQAVEVRYRNGSSTSFDPCQLTHQRPVLDADGVPIREGDTVYGIGRTQHVFVVLGQPGLGGGNGRFKIACHDVTDGVDCHCDPSLLTHTKPERDSWERVEKDTEKSFSEYWGCEEIECSRCPALIDGKTPHEFFGCSHNCTIAMKRDIVRRCKALAEKED